MTEKTRILIVDDNQQIQSLLVEMLGVAGFDTRAAASCADARALLSESTFACGLIDLGLPDGNGLDLLPIIRENHQHLVPIILTGDGRAETIIETMRAGAFDFLIKPFVSASLHAAIKRALGHHDVLRERDDLVQLLKEEREHLKARVEEATADIRQYAGHCELVSARLHSLVRLTQVAANLYTDETVFRSIIEELEKYIPLQCVALESSTGLKFLAAWRNGGAQIHVIAVDDTEAKSGQGRAETDAEERLRGLVRRHAQLETPDATAYVYPQSYWGRPACTVAFFLDGAFSVDADCDQFLSMCAHFLGFEWQDARLSQHATQQASLGNIAVEISKSFIQGLTAIRTTADFVSETPITEEAAEGLRLIRDSVETLHNQIKDFRQLSTPQKESVETVQLSDYVDQAVDMLSRAHMNRNITITREYDENCECVLINGAALARTFLDLIAAALRTVSEGGEVSLSVAGMEPSHILVQIAHDATMAELFGVTPRESRGDTPILIESHPQFILAQRTIQGSGGKLLLKFEEGARRVLNIILPRNPLTAGHGPEVFT